MPDEGAEGEGAKADPTAAESDDDSSEEDSGSGGLEPDCGVQTPEGFSGACSRCLYMGSYWFKYSHIGFRVVCLIDAYWFEIDVSKVFHCWC